MENRVFRRKKSMSPEGVAGTTTANAGKATPLFRVRPRRRRTSNDEKTPEMQTHSSQTYTIVTPSPSSSVSPTKETLDPCRVLALTPSPPSSSALVTPSREENRQTPRKDRRGSIVRFRMDFLNTYFTSTPNRSQARREAHHEDSFAQSPAIEPRLQRQESNDDDDNEDEDESPKSVMDKAHTEKPDSEQRLSRLLQGTSSHSLSTASNYTVQRLTPTQQQHNSNSNTSHSFGGHSQISCAMSPLSEQYAQLRRVRRHYSETDANAIARSMSVSEPTDSSSVHFLAPLAEDLDSLQTIKLTPRIPRTRPSPSAHTPSNTLTPSNRVQSFDDLAFSPHIRSIRTASPHPNSFHYITDNANETDHTDKQSTSSPIKQWLFGTPSNKQYQKDKGKEKDKEKDKDKDKDKTFNFFGLKFRKQTP